MNPELRTVQEILVDIRALQVEVGELLELWELVLERRVDRLVQEVDEAVRRRARDLPEGQGRHWRRLRAELQDHVRRGQEEDGPGLDHRGPVRLDVSTDTGGLDEPDITDPGHQRRQDREEQIPNFGQLPRVRRQPDRPGRGPRERPPRL